MESVEYKNISFTVWDVGGQDKVNLDETRVDRCLAWLADLCFLFAVGFASVRFVRCGATTTRTPTVSSSWWTATIVSVLMTVSNVHFYTGWVFRFGLDARFRRFRRRVCRSSLTNLVSFLRYFV